MLESKAASTRDLFGGHFVFIYLLLHEMDAVVKDNPKLSASFNFFSKAALSKTDRRPFCGMISLWRRLLTVSVWVL